MTEKAVVSQSSLGVTEIAARLTVVLSAAFLALLVLLHFLEPEFDPSWRMISEYELGRYGWMMTLAFFCWGGSVLALRVALRPALRTRGGRIGWWWLLLIGVALFAAGIFYPDPITNQTNSTANSLHALAGTTVIGTFPIAASFVARSLARNPEWASARRLLLWGTLLVWIGLLAFFGSIILSYAINPGAVRGSPDVFMGWPNRFMVVVYHIWLIIIAVRAGHLATSATAT